MRQQFVRIYIGVAVALFLGASATLFIVNREFHAVRRAGFEGRMAELVTMIRARIAEVEEDPDARARMLERISGTYRLSIRLESMADLALPSEEKERVRAGETIAVPAGEGFKCDELLFRHAPGSLPRRHRQPRAASRWFFLLSVEHRERCQIVRGDQSAAPVNRDIARRAERGPDGRRDSVTT